MRDLDHIARDLLQPLRDRVPMYRAKRDHLHDQQVQSALREIGFYTLHFYILHPLASAAVVDRSATLRYSESVELTLHPVELRVLGSLIEKEITTPEYYPLSLNALVNACNQKSNRDPVVSFDEDAVLDAIESLRDKRFATIITGAGSRVPKYAHRFAETLNLGRREIAVLCELMLRGPQTLGELRTRTERMHKFDDISEVESIIERLAEMIVKLPRRPGEKESRYAHLLSGPVQAQAPMTEPHAVERHDRTAALEAEVAQLRKDVENIQQQLADFRKQFE